MKFACKTKIEKTWLVLSIAIIVAYRLLDGSSDSFYTDTHPLMLWLELAMIMLSFPLGGLTVFVLHGVLFWCDDCRNLEFLFDWPTLLIAGYVQWFWVLPEFLRNRKLTLLDLGRAPETRAKAASPAGAKPATAPVPAAASVKDALPAALEATPLRAFDVAAFVPRHAEFDEAGLTALDRIFQAQASPPPAPVSLVEAIFPRVS
jgi:hypothetical protein